MDDLAQLFVRLLFDDSDFAAGSTEAVGKVRALGSNLDNLASGINTKVTRAFVAGTAAVATFTAGVTAGAIAIGSDFDRQIRAVSAILGEGQEGFEAVSGAARELGATTQFTATEAAGALQNLARAGFSAAESVAAAAPSLDLATAAGSDLGLATASLSASLAQFKLDAEESGRVSDVLANATTRTKFGLQGLTNALKNAGTAGEGVGLSLEETVASVAQFRNIGLRASTAGIAFRTSLQRLLKPAADAQKVIEDLGLTLDDVDPTQVPFDELLVRLRDAGAGARDFSVIFGEFGLNVQSVAASIDDADNGMRALANRFENEFGRAAEIAAEASQNVGTQLQILASATQEAFLGVFDAIRQPVLTVLEAVTSTIGRVSERFAEEAGSVEGAAQQIADGIAEFLGDNADAVADSLIALVNGVIALGESFTSVLSVASELSPVLTAIFGILADNLPVTAAAGAFATLSTNLLAVSTGAVTAAADLGLLLNQFDTNLPAVLARATGALRAFGTAVVTTTGGLGLLAAAIAAAAALMLNLTARTREAAEAQRLLRAEQEGTREEAEAQTREQERLGKTLAAQQAAARALIASGEELSADRKRQVDDLLSLNAATLQQAIAAGRVIETGRGFFQVTDLAKNLGKEGVDAIQGIADAAAQQASNVGALVDPLKAQVDQLSGLRGLVDETTNGIADATDKITFGFAASARSLAGVEQSLSDVARAQVRDIEAIVTAGGEGLSDLIGIEERALARAAAEGISPLEAVQSEAARVARQVEIRSKRQAETAQNLANQTARVANQAQEKQTQAVERESAKRVGALKDEAEEARAAAEAAAEAILSALARQRATAIDRGGQAEQRRRELDEELRALQENAAVIAASEEVTASERLRLLNQAAQARALAIANASADILAIERKAAAEVVSIQRDVEQNRLSQLRFGIARQQSARLAAQREIVAVEERGARELAAISERELAAARNPRERIEAFERIAAERIRIDERVAEERIDIEEDTAAQITALTEEQFRRLREFAFDASEQVFGEAGPLSRSLDNLRDKMTSVVQVGLENAPGLTRTFLDVAKAVQSALPALQAFFDQLSGGFISGFDPVGIIAGFSEAREELQGAVLERGQALGDLERAAREAESAVVAAADAGQREIDALRAEGGTAEALTAAEERLRAQQFALETSAAQALGTVATARNQLRLAEQELRDSSVTDEVDAAANRAIDFVEGVGSSLDEVLTAFADRLPDVLGSVAANLDRIITSAVTGAVDIVRTVLAQLPDILGSILSALPGIITELGAGVAGIITDLATVVPDILIEIANNLDQIIVALFEAVQDIGAALLRLPLQLVQGLLDALPDIVTGLIDGLPDILDAFFETLFGPTGLVDFLPELITTLIELVIIQLPQIALSLAEALFLQLPAVFISSAISFVEKLATELLPNLADAAVEFVNKMVENIGDFFTQSGEDFGNTVLDILTVGLRTIGERDKEDRKGLGKVFGAVGDIFRNNNRVQADTRNARERQRLDALLEGTGLSVQGRQGGESFVQRAGLRMVHPGEAILDAATNRRRVFEGGASPAAPTGAANIAAAGAPSGPTIIGIQIGGEDFDRFQVRQSQLGHRGLSESEARRATGTRSGFTRRN